jgi:tetratricopeptide (TPR) repeat protein
MRALITLAIAVLAASAHGAPREKDPTTARARELFEHAEALYALERYDEALAEYAKAFEARPLPGFLFNIGQCHRQLAHYERAAYFYRTYLERDPRARNRALVESLIAEMDEKALRKTPPVEPPPVEPPPVEPVAEQRPHDVPVAPPTLEPPAPAPAPAPRVTPLPPITAPAPETPRPAYKRWYVWTAVVGSVALAGLAVGLGVGLTQSGLPHGTLTSIDAR